MRVLSWSTSLNQIQPVAYHFQIVWQQTSDVRVYDRLIAELSQTNPWLVANCDCVVDWLTPAVQNCSNWVAEWPGTSRCPFNEQSPTSVRPLVGYTNHCSCAREELQIIHNLLGATTDHHRCLQISSDCFPTSRPFAKETCDGLHVKVAVIWNQSDTSSVTAALGRDWAQWEWEWSLVEQQNIFH